MTTCAGGGGQQVFPISAPPDLSINFFYCSSQEELVGPPSSAANFDGGVLGNACEQIIWVLNMRRTTLQIACALASGVLLSCGGGSSGSSPTSPTAPMSLPTLSLTLTGTWTGTGTDLPINHSFGLTMTLAQNGANITGSWSTATGNSGPLTGVVNGSTVTITASNVEGEPDCTTLFDGQRDGDNRLSGTFESGPRCSDDAMGRFDLARQTSALACSGMPVGRVEISLNTPGTYQVYGETFEVTQASGQSPFQITRDVVPCEYVFSGRVANPGPIIVGFLRTAPFERGANPGGVERGSIMIEVGDNPTFETPCVLEIRSAGTGGTEIRFRFRVVGTNGNECSV